MRGGEGHYSREGLLGRLRDKHGTKDIHRAVAAEVLGCAADQVTDVQRRAVKEALYVWLYSGNPGPLPWDLVRTVLVAP